MDCKMEHLFFDNLRCKIHYFYRKGTGDKWVLFFHGAGCDHRMFEPQFGAFDETYNLLAWDARGHGLSKLEPDEKFRFRDMISDCKKLFELYGIKKAVLIGQSMGGNLAQEIAYSHPEMVEKLVLIDCSRNTQSLSAVEKFSLAIARPLFFLYPWKTLIKQSAVASANNKSVQEYIESCFDKLGKAAFVNIVMEMAACCLHEDRQFRFAQPVLLLCGEDDRLGNIRKALKTLAHEDKNCTLYFIGNASHNSNQDNPEKVNELIAAFLKNQEHSAAYKND